MIPQQAPDRHLPKATVIAGSLNAKTNLRWIAMKIWIVAMVVAMGVALSGCTPGRGGISHNYSNEYGSGTVFYTSGGYHHAPPPPPHKHKKPKKHKKEKKHRKPPKHDRHDRGRHHDD